MGFSKYLIVLVNVCTKYEGCPPATVILRLRDTRARALRNVLGNVHLSSLTKNLWYEEREQLDSGGGGALSRSAGHDGSFF